MLVYTKVLIRFSRNGDGWFAGITAEASGRGQVIRAILKVCIRIQ